MSDVKGATMEKFKQNPHLLQYLMSTKTKTLAEGSTDCVWGTGLKLQDPGNMDHNLWKGKKLVG